MPSDIEIAQAAKMQRIAAVAKEKLGIGEEHLEPYGHYKAKVSLKYLETLKGRKNGKLILVQGLPRSQIVIQPDDLIHFLAC